MDKIKKYVKKKKKKKRKKKIDLGHRFVGWIYRCSLVGCVVVRPAGGVGVFGVSRPPSDIRLLVFLLTSSPISHPYPFTPRPSMLSLAQGGGGGLLGIKRVPTSGGSRVLKMRRHQFDCNDYNDFWSGLYSKN